MPLTLTTFDGASPDLAWQVVNDGVMGGRSRGGYRIDGGVLVFSGCTDTRGGGFCSIRSAAALPDMADASAIRLRLRGDGRRYILRLADRAGVAYWADFPTAAAAGGWESVDVGFERFVPRRRGRVLAGPPLEPSRIGGIGLMIYDGADGPFRLEVDRIEAC